METPKEWLIRRVEDGDCKFFPVDKEDMLRVIHKLEEGEKNEKYAEQLNILQHKKKVFEHISHILSCYSKIGRNKEKYLSGEINILFQFGLITAEQYWHLEEEIAKKSVCYDCDGCDD
jgi:hypothetical protein